MTFLVLLLSLAAWAEPVQSELYRVEGQPAYCTEDDRSRAGHRELPEIDLGITGRDKAEVLHMKVVKHGWTAEKDFSITVRLQVISCLRDEEGVRYKFFEQPDAQDWAEAHVATGLFNGHIFRADFRRVIFVESDDDDENVYYAQFIIPQDKLFSSRHLKKFRDGKNAETSVQITYHYKNNESHVRPPFIFERDEKRFPGTFSLELLFTTGKLKKISQGSR
jgi:hypothetical protein